MQNTKLKILAISIVTVFSIVTAQGSLITIAAALTDEVELTVRIKETGFYDSNNRRLGPQNPLIVPKARTVKIQFLFDEGLNSLAIGDTHQIAITGDAGPVTESGRVWAFNRKSTVTLHTPETAPTRYRGYCILDCIGMDHLNNLIIVVQ